MFDKAELSIRHVYCIIVLSTACEANLQSARTLGLSNCSLSQYSHYCSTMPVSRAQKKSAAVKARLRRYRKAQQSDAGSDDDKPKSKTPTTYQPSSSLYDEDTEDAEDYRPGGYHPLKVGLELCEPQFPHLSIISFTDRRYLRWAIFSPQETWMGSILNCLVMSRPCPYRG